MPENKYKVTLYSRRWREEILVYDFPDVLPAKGDLIEIIEEDVFFVVYERAFKSKNDDEEALILVTLFGEIEGHDENTSRVKFDAILKKLEYKLGNANNSGLYLFERS